MLGRKLSEAEALRKQPKSVDSQSGWTVNGEQFKSRIQSLQTTFKPRQVKIYKPRSEFPELVVDVPDSWDKIQLAPLYDVHIGSGNQDEELFHHHLDWIARTPNVLTFNGGDMVENATKESPGASVICQRGTPNEQLFRAAKTLAKIQHKMLFAIPGNHEDRTFNVAGLDGAEQLAEHLQLPYFQDYCFMTLRWRGNNFRVCAHHGSGAAQTPGAQRNAARKDMPWSHFDIFWCFPAGTPVLMADGTMKGIDTVKPGDSIISGSGRIVPVRNVTRQPFKGKLVSMTAFGWPEPILATPNHPMAALRLSKDETKDGFHRADSLAHKDALKRVRFSEPETIPDITPDIMRLYGYYLSEGCAWKSKCGKWAQLTFSFAADEEHTLYKDCVSLLRSLGYNPKPMRNKRGTALTARVCSHEAVAHFKGLFGHLSHKKSIPASFLTYPKEHLTELLNGIFLGDGHTTRQGCCLSTTSRKMAEQVLFILSAILDEPASFGTRNRAQKLQSYTVFRGHEIGKTKWRKYKRHDGNWYSPLREVSRPDFNGDVYCLHIGDPDPTFVVGPFVVHNTGHLHQPMMDVVYQIDFDQKNGGTFERNAVVIISPSYVKYFNSYAAKRRMSPGQRGLGVVVLNPDGRIDGSMHARGRRL